MECLDTILANLEVSQLLMGSGRLSSMPPAHFLHPFHVIPCLPHNVIVIQCTTLWSLRPQRISRNVCTPGDKMLSKTPISTIRWFIPILLSAGHYSCGRKPHYLNNRHCLTQKPKRKTSSQFCDRILLSLSFEFPKELLVILHRGKEKRKGLHMGDNWTSVLAKSNPWEPWNMSSLCFFVHMLFPSFFSLSLHFKQRMEQSNTSPIIQQSILYTLIMNLM